MTDARLISTTWNEALVDLPNPTSRRELQDVATALREGLRDCVKGLTNGQKIVISRHNLSKALACPASAAETEFRPTAILTSRALALLALDSPLGDRTLLDNLAEVIERCIRSGHWTADFLKDQESGRRGSTMAYAMSWANRALSQVPRQLFSEAEIVHSQMYHNPFGYDSAVAVKGKPDAILRPPGGAANDRVLLSFVWPDVKAAALEALVVGLKFGTVPRRCLVACPQRGSLDMVDVDVDLLSGAAEDIIRAAAAIVPALRGERLHTEVGTRCWTCAHQNDCVPGQSWMKVQPRRRGGLLID